MAKRKKKRIKKRLKRHLIKQNKAIIKEEKAKVAVAPEIVAELPRKEIRLDLYVGKYARENELYQLELNKVYNGTVIPVERYISQKASILHTCTECQKEWYSRPGWLLTKANQKHVCGVDTAKSAPTKLKRKNVGKKEKLQMVRLAEEGLSVSKIAMQLGLSRPTVTKYLKELSS
ncbi:helix-turn-helix domain-containing protein [Priestia megaterium]|uniref:helix-turn-helix domain-containing protein n=1 Tax=Priestia megaterium TaxID=1404 RepID=UPI00339A6E5A